MKSDEWCKFVPLEKALKEYMPKKGQRTHEK